MLDMIDMIDTIDMIDMIDMIDIIYIYIIWQILYISYDRYYIYHMIYVYIYIDVSIYLRIYKTISLYIYIFLQYHFFYIQWSPITSVGFVLPHFWSHKPISVARRRFGWGWLGGGEWHEGHDARRGHRSWATEATLRTFWKNWPGSNWQILSFLGWTWNLKY